jgi:hypothetical protein
MIAAFKLIFSLDHQKTLDIVQGFLQIKGGFVSIS